jgi:uncharacterized protein (TIGR00369 family)
LAQEFDIDDYCFACGPRNPIGLKVRPEFSDGEASFEFTPRREHCGYMDVVHGGILATLLDEAMVYAACSLGGTWATARMETRFKGPAHDGETLLVHAGLIERRGKVATFEASIHGPGDRLIADAKGTIIRVSDREVHAPEW